MTGRTLVLAIDAWWIVSFAIALVYAIRMRRLAIEDRAELIAEKTNGPALIEAGVAIRRAVIRIYVSFMMLLAGVGGLAVSEEPRWNTLRVIFTAASLTFATVYALQGWLEERDRNRTLDLLAHLKR